MKTGISICSVMLLETIFPVRPTRVYPSLRLGKGLWRVGDMRDALLRQSRFLYGYEMHGFQYGHWRYPKKLDNILYVHRAMCAWASLLPENPPLTGSLRPLYDYVVEKEPLLPDQIVLAIISLTVGFIIQAVLYALSYL